MSVLVDVVNAITEVSQTIEDFTSDGIYSFFTQFTAWAIQWYMVAWFQVKLYSLTFAYGVAQQMITNLQISQFLNTTYSSLDSQTMAAINFLRIPDAINMIVSAAMTKFVFRFLGF